MFTSIYNIDSNVIILHIIDTFFDSYAVNRHVTKQSWMQSNYIWTNVVSVWTILLKKKLNDQIKNNNLRD